jgi:hypothetical protein
VIWLFIVLAAVAVFLIAALTVGREARRLDAVAPRAVYEIEQAVDFVAALLPQATQARLTPEELNQLLVMHLNWLHEKGLMPVKAVDQRQTIDTPVIIAEDSLIGYLLGESERAGIEMLEDVDIVAVTEAHLAYFDAIGAVGPTATDAGSDTGAGPESAV